MAGGAVKGGQILGDYPPLGEDSEVNLGRGRLLPTTSWEQVCAQPCAILSITPARQPTQMPARQLRPIHNTVLLTRYFSVPPLPLYYCVRFIANVPTLCSRLGASVLFAACVCRSGTASAAGSASPTRGWTPCSQAAVTSRARCFRPTTSSLARADVSSRDPQMQTFP